MANAVDHARIASVLLASPVDYYSGQTPDGQATLAAAHAQTSRAWSAIGRDQAVTEAAQRRQVCTSKAGGR